MTFVTFKICPLIACGFFGYFLLSESIWGTLTLSVLVSSIRNSVETLVGFDSVKWQIARKHQIDVYARFIDVTLDPSCSRLTELLLLVPEKRPKTIHYGPCNRNGSQAHFRDQTRSKSPARTRAHGPYPNLNPRRIFGDILPNRYVIGYLQIVG